MPLAQQYGQSAEQMVKVYCAPPKKPEEAPKKKP
jgi:hypothetical protein